MKKYILTALAALFLGTVILNAIPAYPGWIKYTQPDGSVIQIRKVGDEFGHYTLNQAGQYIQMDEDGFYRPVDASVVQAQKARAKARRHAAAQQRRAGEHIALGQKHFLVVLVEFKDLSFTSSTAHDDFHNLLNQQGYSANGGTGSARDFYYDNSHGLFEPIFDVYGPIKLNNSYSYYGANDSGGNDKHPEEAVISACQKIDDDVDFSQYDIDGDGFVDLVFMYYAGQGEADGGAANTIWPHQWNIYYGAGKTVELDRVKLDSYACTNEISGGKMCGIGTACHEFGHAMGLPDFYDSDYDTNGECAALFDFSTMCGGSYNNDGRTPPYFNLEERILLGWIDDSAYQEFSMNGPYTIPSVQNDIAYRTYTDMAGEYFAYECRSKEGWDKYLPSYGLIVYHVDKSTRSVKIDGATRTAKYLWENWEADNSINENGSHPCFYVVPAVDQDNLYFGYELYGQYYYFDPYDKGYAQQIPFPGSKNITTYTPVSWNGVESEITLSGITYAANQVTLTATVPFDGIDYNVISNPGSGHYSSGDRFSFELEESASRPVQSVVWYYDDEPVQADSVTLTSGAHTVEAHLTLVSGNVKIVTLEITVN